MFHVPCLSELNLLICWAGVKCGIFLLTDNPQVAVAVPIRPKQHLTTLLVTALPRLLLHPQITPLSHPKKMIGNLLANLLL